MKNAVFLILLLTIAGHYSIAQKAEWYGPVVNGLKENQVYLFCRGTQSKAGIVAGKFNLADRQITHLGIGYRKGHRVYIYNVVDERNHINALVVDSLPSFITGDTRYFSIWTFSHTTSQFADFQKQMESYGKRRIYFDAFFNLRNDDTLYCSEFAAAVLNQILPQGKRFLPSTIQLNDQLFQLFLKRKTLVYYPVDFFETGTIFRKIYETRL